MDQKCDPVVYIFREFFLCQPIVHKFIDMSVYHLSIIHYGPMSRVITPSGCTPPPSPLCLRSDTKWALKNPIMGEGQLLEEITKRKMTEYFLGKFSFEPWGP